MRHPLLALADVHRLTTVVRGRTLEGYVFDHHRTALTVWAHVAGALGRPLTLVTLDRHMDLNTPPAEPPDHRQPLATMDHFVRHQLAPSNDDHIPAALEAGALADAVVIARSHEPPDLARFKPYRDRAGRVHRFAFAKTPAHVREDVLEIVRESQAIALDVDLDCFTTMSDGDPEEVLAWDAGQIARFLRPPGSEALWDEVLSRTAVITIAREPYHCGGFERGARLWLAFSEAFFRGLLGTEAP